MIELAKHASTCKIATAEEARERKKNLLNCGDLDMGRTRFFRSASTLFTFVKKIMNTKYCTQRYVKLHFHELKNLLSKSNWKSFNNILLSTCSTTSTKKVVETKSITFDFHIRQRYNLLNQTKPGVNFNCINKKCIKLILLYKTWNNILFFMEICTKSRVKKRKSCQKKKLCQ